MIPAARAEAPPISARVLWADPLWLLVVAVAMITALPYAVPIFSPDATWTYAVYYADLPLVATVLLVLEASRRRAPRRRGGAFWAAWLAAIATWMTSAVGFVLFPDFTLTRIGELTGDLFNVLYYLFAFLAATTLPHLERPAGKADDPGITPQALGAWLLCFFLTGYFVFIPVTLEPEIYNSYVPSYLLYLTLDVLLVASYLRLAQLAGGSGWRRTYVLVALTAVIWLGLDTVEFLQWVETLPWSDAGSRLDILWVLPFLPLVAAARLHALRPSPPLPSATAPAMLSRRHSGRAALVLYTAAFPILHFGGYAIGVSEPSIRQAREACVFLAVVVLGGLALIAHRRLEAERARAEARIREQTERMRALSHRLARAQEEERHQIARELHDEIGQQLTGLSLSLGALRHRGDDVSDRTVAQIEEQFGELLRQVRELSLSLRPTMLDDYGLVAALKYLFKRLAEQADLRIRFEPLAPCEDMPAAAQLATYRIVQEALTNVLRHAGVDEAVVRLEADRQTYFIDIIDRGAGFDTAVAPVGASCGIDGMHERATLLGGTLEVRSAPQQGTRIKVKLPRPG